MRMVAVRCAVPRDRKHVSVLLERASTGASGENPLLFSYAAVAQLAEQGFCKAQVGGSSPLGGTKF